MKKWLRFSLRTMLLLITALCIWLGFQVNAARRQREAVAVLQEAGAEIFYDYQMVPVRGYLGKMVDPNQPPAGPAWLRHLLGDDYFCTVVAVRFTRPRASIHKADLHALAKLPSLREFVFLDHDGTDVRDNDFTALSEFRRLEELVLQNAMRVNGSSLASLANPGRLKVLGLIDTGADDAALKHVEDMTVLETLCLGGTRVTDSGLVHVRNLKNLTILRLESTNITDAGLQHLYGLKKLALLCLQGTQVSDAGVSALREALPNARIHGP